MSQPLREMAGAVGQFAVCHGTIVGVTGRRTRGNRQPVTRDLDIRKVLLADLEQKYSDKEHDLIGVHEIHISDLERGKRVSEHSARSPQL